MAQLTILDAGPLYAALDRRDRHHESSAGLLRDRRYAFVIPALALAEVQFAAGLESWRIEAPLPQEWSRIAELVRTYADWPLGITDASVAVLAERLNTDVLATLDHRHFGAMRPAHCPAFQLLPAI